MDRSILLVDGDVNFRRSLAIGLRLEGVRVAEASGPVDAFRHLRGGDRFDLALVDLLLPIDSALDLVGWLRSRYPAIRPLLCCARPEAFAAAGIRAAGLERLDKPFPPEALLPFFGGRAPGRVARR